MSGLNKDIDVEFDVTSFSGGVVPVSICCAPSVSVDVTEALLMLGGLTTPSGFSSASPARFWAWLRYFAAVHSSPDLRVTGPFVDLDPHQKTILSDDFGVAITTRWLHERLGGFADLVDGRRFMLQYAALLSATAKSTSKVGLSKCPDFVVLDNFGKWHVIECKGTQKSVGYRNKQIESAQIQKRIIDVVGAVKGEQLALGVFLANERQKRRRSSLRVVDPEADAYVTVTDEGTETARFVLARLAAARALSLSGFDDFAEELALPASIKRFSTEEMKALFTFEERRYLTRPEGERFESAIDSLRDSSRRATFELDGLEFLGFDVVVGIPGKAFRSNTGCRAVRLQQGASLELVGRLRDTPADADGVVRSLFQESRVSFRRDGASVALREGALAATRIEFLE